jgi:hypothetical protein
MIGQFKQEIAEAIIDLRRLATLELWSDLTLPCVLIAAADLLEDALLHGEAGSMQHGEQLH